MSFKTLYQEDEKTKDNMAKQHITHISTLPSTLWHTPSLETTPQLSRAMLLRKVCKPPECAHRHEDSHCQQHLNHLSCYTIHMSCLFMLCMLFIFMLCMQKFLKSHQVSFSMQRWKCCFIWFCWWIGPSVWLCTSFVWTPHATLLLHLQPF